MNQKTESYYRTLGFLFLMMACWAGYVLASSGLVAGLMEGAKLILVAGVSYGVGKVVGLDLCERRAMKMCVDSAKAVGVRVAARVVEAVTAGWNREQADAAAKDAERIVEAEVAAFKRAVDSKGSKDV